jgi:hypothetical protein
MLIFFVRSISVGWARFALPTLQCYNRGDYEELAMYEKAKQTNYVSGIDQFLQEFDKQHPELSKSQRKEIEKSQRISRLRDKKEAVDPNKTIWDNF